MQKIKHSNIVLGVPLLLVVFVVLFLVSFSTLSYLHSKSELDMVERTVEIVEEYYLADYKAMDVRMEIDTLLSEKGTIDDIKTDIPDILTENNMISYDIIINDNQALKIVLEVVENNGNLGTNIVSWKVEINSDYEY